MGCGLAYSADQRLVEEHCPRRFGRERGRGQASASTRLPLRMSQVPLQWSVEYPFLPRRRLTTSKNSKCFVLFLLRHLAAAISQRYPNPALQKHGWAMARFASEAHGIMDLRVSGWENPMQTWHGFRVYHGCRQRCPGSHGASRLHWLRFSAWRLSKRGCDRVSSPLLLCKPRPLRVLHPSSGQKTTKASGLGSHAITWLRCSVLAIAWARQAHNTRNRSDWEGPCGA